jgi:hypothetical protein
VSGEKNLLGKRKCMNIAKHKKKIEQWNGLEGPGDCITSHVAGTVLQGGPLESFA